MKQTLDDPDSSWGRLSRLLEREEIAFFVGAGLSIPNNLPSWRGLTARLSKTSDETVDILEREGISFASQIGLIKNSLDCSPREWTKRLRLCLYKETYKQIEELSSVIKELTVSDFDNKDVVSRKRVVKFFERTNPVLLELIKFMSIKSRQRFDLNSRVGAILTTNLDPLIQLCDRAYHGSPRITRTVERSNANSYADKISLYHLHGYIPLIESGAKPCDLVLSDDEYLERNDGPYGWANVTLHWALREFSLLFVGCSMNDELIRRALRRQTTQRIEALEAQKGKNNFKERRWRRHFAVVKWSDNLIVNEAKNSSLAQLGVWPLWVDDFGEDLLRRTKEIFGGVSDKMIAARAVP